MSSRSSRIVFLGILSVLFLIGMGEARGQNADPNSGGPSKNNFRLRILEPLDGATIVGGSVRVALANAIGQPSPPSSSARTSDMPDASYRVYLGNTLKGELKRGENVIVIDNVASGSQKLVVEALNTSGEIIGRKEVLFRTVPDDATTASLPPVPGASSTSSSPSAPSAATASTSPDSPAASPSPSTAPETSAMSEESKGLPATGSSAPRTGLLGAALVIGGLLVTRKVAR